LTFLVETAPAKINLTLRVVGRRADGYHELESLVAFADLADRLTLEPGEQVGLETKGPFAAASGPVDGNLVLKAVRALSGRIATLKAGRFSLEKNTPVAGGLGGGSADAAAALRLLARHNNLAADDNRVAVAALATGADVPVCLASQSCIMRGIGERLSPPVELPPLPAILVNPRVPLATADVFAAFAKYPANSEPLGEPPFERDALFEFLARHGNDLTAAAVAVQPLVADVLETLGKLPGVRLVRMSGSGPTCFALFSSASETVAAAAVLRSAHGNWWVRAGSIAGT